MSARATNRRYLLGIDSGLTVTKAAIFRDDGEAVACASGRIEQIKERAHFVERDMSAHWDATAHAIGTALTRAGLSGSDIAAIGVTGHGDGLYLLDEDEQPLGHAILSLDSRAQDIVARWRDDGTAERALSLTGQIPFEAAPSALLAWIREHEPERYRRIRWLLSCKDWLRFRLTGQVATDLTESSVSFTDCRTQAYSDEALALFGHRSLAHALPSPASPFEITGVVSESAAAATGLIAGTPVVAGLHDISAATLGMGILQPGLLSLVAGTYSINEIICRAPLCGPHWLCRNGLFPGQWKRMSISPASSANIEWFVQEYCRDALEAGRQSGRSPFVVLQEELEQADRDDSDVIYHPFLFGSPYGSEPAAAFLNLRGWHRRGHMLRALAEGVVFNHRHHIDYLDPQREIGAARLSGGSARNPYFCQLFADVLGRTVDVAGAEEIGALGAAICAAVGIGLHRDAEAAVAAMVNVFTTYTPQPARVELLEARYRRYRESIDKLWPRLAHEEHGTGQASPPLALRAL